MLPRLALTLAVVAVAAGCTGDGRGQLGPERLVTPTELSLERNNDGTFRTLTAFAGCQDDLRLTHVETPTEVRVSVYLRKYESNGEAEPACAASSSVTLGSPLGDRRVIDAKSGRPVQVK
jgi:hypothetical protein